MPHVILPHNTIRQASPVPPRTMRERLAFVGVAFVRGVMTFGGKLAALTGFVGGSVLTYLLFVVKLTLPWAIVSGLVVVPIVFVMGAYQLWDEADRAAWRFAPTWEMCQLRADTLTALTEEYIGQPGPFRRQYMAGHMGPRRGRTSTALARRGIRRTSTATGSGGRSLPT